MTDTVDSDHSGYSLVIDIQGTMARNQPSPRLTTRSIFSPLATNNITRIAIVFKPGRHEGKLGEWSCNFHQLNISFMSNTHLIGRPCTFLLPWRRLPDDATYCVVSDVVYISSFPGNGCSVCTNFELFYSRFDIICKKNDAWSHEHDDTNTQTPQSNYYRCTHKILICNGRYKSCRPSLTSGTNNQHGFHEEENQSAKESKN